MLLEPHQWAHRQLWYPTVMWPALVERAVGAGRVALLTTTADRTCLIGLLNAYLPMVRRSPRYLARRGTPESTDEAFVASDSGCRVAGSERVTIIDPTGERFVPKQKWGAAYVLPANPWPPSGVSKGRRNRAPLSRTRLLSTNVNPENRIYGLQNPDLALHL